MTGEDVTAIEAEKAAASGALDQAETWRQALAAGADQLDAAATTAMADAANATAKKAGAQSVADAATARAAVVTAYPPAATLAYVTLLRDEVAALHTRDAQIAAAIAELYDWRATLDGGYALVCRSLAWLGRLVGRGA